MVDKVLLLFPPNWSACVSGPHLAMPLLAGAAMTMGCTVEVVDLSEQFYRTYALPPTRAAVSKASREQNFEALDQLYFDWEDQLRQNPSGAEYGVTFGLLSGYHFEYLRSRPLSEIVNHLNEEGTLYSSFLNDYLLPKLLGEPPNVIAVTIASQEQVIPAIELLRFVRNAVPNAFLALGGNIVTRLRDTKVFNVLASLADQTALFQGDLAFSRLLKAVNQVGVHKAKEILPRVVSEEQIPYELWPVPAFMGIAFPESVGTPVLSYVSTRGCYWGKCHFCAIPAGWAVKGYGGSAPGSFVASQLVQMVTETGIPRVKFVDEAIPPSKVRLLSTELCRTRLGIEWEGYARLEAAWGNKSLLEEAYAGGLRKLYFGLEQSPSTDRSILGKNDYGDPLSIIRACTEVGIKIHLFCMVGHPGSSRADADATVRFLIENESLIDTADMVGFRLDRGTSVPGVRPALDQDSDWLMSLRYEPTQDHVLAQKAVEEIEASCQEALWEAVPRLLHPLYRIIGHWDTSSLNWAKELDHVSKDVIHKARPSEALASI